MFSYPLYAYNLQAQFTWGSQGRVEQWHNKNVHPPQLMKIEALTLSPVNSRTPSFCHFLCNSWNKLAHLQLQCAIQGCSYSSHSNYFPAQEKYPQEQALAIGIHRGIKSRCSCSCWAHRHSLFVFHSSALSSGEYLRTGQLQAWSSFLYWKADMSAHEGGKGAEGHF